MVKKSLIWLLTLCCIAFFAAIGLAQPQLPPAPTSSLYVQDYAGVLSSETKTKINQLGGKIAAQTKAQVVVVTVQTLNDEPIRDYALALLRGWKIGDQTLNNGVVFLVDLTGKQSRIEVGYGLEGALNDAKVGQIQDEYSLPYFQRGDYDQGIWNGYKAIMREVSREYGLEAPNNNRALPQPSQNDVDDWWNSLPWWAQGLILGGVILLVAADWLFFGGNITILILSLLRFRGRGGGGGGYGGGSGGGGGADRKW